jgi:hypothetical protein
MRWLPGVAQAETSWTVMPSLGEGTNCVHVESDVAVWILGLVIDDLYSPARRRSVVPKLTRVDRTRSVYIMPDQLVLSQAIATTENVLTGRTQRSLPGRLQ